MAQATRFVWILAVALACFFQARRATAHERRPTVLVIDSYGGSWETARQVAAGLRRDVHGKNGAPLEFVEVSLRPGHDGASSVEEPLLDYVNALFREEAPVLVIALGRAAGRFVFEHRSRVFPAAPSLTLLAIRQDFAALPLGTNDAYVSFEFDVAWVIDTLLRTFPSTHRLFIVFGHTASEQRLREAFKPFFAAQYPGLAVMWANDLTLQGLTDSVAQLPSDSLVVYGGFDVDAANERVEDALALPRVLASASVPTAAVYADKLGSGVAATAHADVESYVREASSAARELLAGTPAVNLRTAPAPAMRASFDARALERFGIDRGLVPATAYVVNDRARAWSEGGAVVTLGAVFLALQALTAIALALGWRRARARQHEVRAAYTRGMQLRETIIGRRTGEARVSLTRRIARLSAEAANPTRRRTNEEATPEDHEGALRDLGARIEEALVRVAPGTLDDLGLEAALRVECGARREESSLDVLFAGRAPAVGLSSDLAVTLLRALQMLLDATSADATPRTVNVTLTVEAERALLRIDDALFAKGPGLARDASFLRAFDDVRALLHAVGGGASIEANAGDAHVIAWVPALA